MSDFFVQFLNGVTIAMTIYLIASGLSLVFGVLGVLNFAHGSLYMYGSFLLFTLMRSVFHTPGSFWVGLLVVPLLVALLGAALEMGFLRFIYRADPCTSSSSRTAWCSSSAMWSSSFGAQKINRSPDPQVLTDRWPFSVSCSPAIASS